MQTLELPVYTEPKISRFVLVVIVVEIAGGVAAVGGLRPCGFKTGEITVEQVIDTRTDAERFIETILRAKVQHAIALVVATCVIDETTVALGARLSNNLQVERFR